MNIICRECRHNSRNEFTKLLHQHLFLIKDFLEKESEQCIIPRASLKKHAGFMEYKTNLRISEVLMIRS